MLTAAVTDGIVVLLEFFRFRLCRTKLSPFPDEFLLLHSHCQCLSSASISSCMDYSKQVLTGDDGERSDQTTGIK